MGQGLGLRIVLAALGTPPLLEREAGVSAVLPTKQGVPSTCPARPSELERLTSLVWMWSGESRPPRRVALTPSVELGIRQDGGDAETGRGLDLGPGLVFAGSVSGLAVDIRVRRVLVH